MKNSIIRSWYIIFFALGVFTLFTQCEKDDPKPVIIFEVDNNGYSRFNLAALELEINNLPREVVSEAEEAGLIFMREEEKLAHDVYSQLYEVWSSQVFDHIAQSELTHTEAVLLLLKKYDLDDPVGTNGVGIFVNSTLQNLYDSLTTVGYQSEIEALKTGALIEEIDILDLQNELDLIVNNKDIELVYNHLQRGSRNHLRAFVKNLANKGVTYVPQVLSPEIYEDIINNDMETGG